MPPPHVPSPPLPQADVQVLPEHVGVPFEHTLQVPPPVPHAPLALPAAHCPPEQQPPLQAVSPALPHAAPHVCVVVLHALPAGQSVAALHPQTWSPGTHSDPFGLPAQLTHAPEAPQAALLVPGRHAIPLPQQPLTQGCAGMEQVKLHRCDVVLHPALEAGQLVLLLHPQKPPPVVATHALPEVPPPKPALQSAHTPPFSPHAPAPVPGWHVPPVAAEQHPPLHVCVVLQAVVQVWVAVSHALPAGQSAALWQPHRCGDPPERHAVPLALPAQEAQRGWPTLQSPVVVPVSHVLVAGSQQPPLHALCCAPPQVAPHVPVVRSQAEPVGQSLGWVHPGGAVSAGASAVASFGDASGEASGEASGGSSDVASSLPSVPVSLVVASVPVSAEVSGGASTVASIPPSVCASLVGPTSAVASRPASAAPSFVASTEASISPASPVLPSPLPLLEPQPHSASASASATERSPMASRSIVPPAPTLCARRARSYRPLGHHVCPAGKADHPQPLELKRVIDSVPAGTDGMIGVNVQPNWIGAATAAPTVRSCP